ncbi:MAG: thioredoxin family protein [Hormoscilla sp.]
MSVMNLAGTPISSYAPDFEVPGVDDEVHHLARYLEEYQVVAVIFISNNCPYVQHYLERLKQLQTELASMGVTLIGMNANDTTQDRAESMELMKIFATSGGMNFPYLRDVTQDVARSFGASRTPEAFVLDHQGILRYRGLIDDNPEDAAAVQVSYLRQAIGQVLEGQPVTIASTDPVGSEIKWRRH